MFPGTPNRVVDVRIAPHLQPLFNGRELVPAPEFELELRRFLHREREEERDRTVGMQLHIGLMKHIGELRVATKVAPMSDVGIAMRVKEEYKRRVLAQMKIEGRMIRPLQFSPD